MWKNGLGSSSTLKVPNIWILWFSMFCRWRPISYLYVPSAIHWSKYVLKWTQLNVGRQLLIWKIMVLSWIQRSCLCFSIKMYTMNSIDLHNQRRVEKKNVIVTISPRYSFFFSNTTQNRFSVKIVAFIKFISKLIKFSYPISLWFSFYL